MRAAVPCLLLSFAPTLAVAQPDAGPAKAQEIRSVERGAFVEGDVGLAVLLTSIDRAPLSPLGMSTSVAVGYDFTPFLSVALGGLALFGSGTYEPTKPPASDLLWVAPMLELRVALLTTERNFLWGQAGAGFAFALPEKVGGADFGGNGPIFAAGVAYERFTKLRHFSIGAQAGILAALEPGLTLAISIAPNLKYTF